MSAEVLRRAGLPWAREWVGVVAVGVESACWCDETVLRDEMLRRPAMRME